MTALFKIIKKNLKLLIRSKSSALIIILGPLLVIFLVGIAFDNISQYSLKIGTYSESYSDLSDSLIAKLTDKDFRVTKFNTEQACIEKVKTSHTHACIVFPKDLEIVAGKTSEVVFHVDYSKLNLIYACFNALKKLNEVMFLASNCGLGQVALSTLVSAIDKFKDEFLKRIRK